MMIKAVIPTEHANVHFGHGTFGETMQKILGELKPESAYFALENGCRTGYFVVNMNDPSELPAKCEPLFLAFNAKLEVTPCMVPEDLMKAGPDIERAAKTYFPRQAAGVR
jgi:hypothetical protein